MRYYMVSPQTCHISLTKDTTLLLGYCIMLLLLFLICWPYRQTHFSHPGCRNVPLDVINLLANNIKANVNEVTLYQMKLKSMKRKTIYYPPNEKRS